MSVHHQQLRLNSPAVVWERLQRDAVFVHFESGLYYSVRGLSCEICDWIMKGHRVDVVVEALSYQYHLQSQELPAVEDFLRRLMDAHLLVPAATPPVSGVPSFVATAYQTPQLEVFDDMADQLLLDKIEDETRDAWVTPRQ